MRQFAPVEYNAMKTATKMVVAELGGVDAAASTTRVGRSQLSDYGVPTQDKYCPIDVVADMEKVAGTPFITTVMARLAGFSLVKIMPTRHRSELAQLLSRIGKDTGELFATASIALTHPRPSCNERVKLLQELDDLRRATEEAIQYLTEDHA